MDFTKKDLESLQEFKNRNSCMDIPISGNFCYIHNQECIFIHKSRKNYHVLCSPQCHELALFPQNQFDVCFATQNFDEALMKFYQYVFDSIKRHTKEIFVCPV